jgi:hypothetical protein
MIFGQSRAEPWYGKNAGLMQGLSTGLRDVELTGRHLLSVPGPGIYLSRDKLSSIAYSEQLNSTKISATFQSMDRRHAIVG